MNRAPFKVDKSLTQLARIEVMLHITSTCKATYIKLTYLYSSRKVFVSYILELCR